MPEAFDGGFAGDRDGGGVEELGDAWSGEGGADDGAAIGVDEGAGSAAVVRVVLDGAGDVAEIVVDDVDAAAGAPGFDSGEADTGDLGVGEDDLRYGRGVGGAGVRAPGAGVERGAAGSGGDDGAGDAGLVLALVGEQGPPVDVARGRQSPDAAVTVRVSSVVSQSPGVRPTVSRPMSPVRGARPVAKRISSAVSRPPSERVMRTLPPVRAAVATVTPNRRSVPASRRRSATSSPAKGSICGSRRVPRARRVTSVPRACQAVAISVATTPAPTMTSRPGGCGALVASRLVQGRRAASQGRSGRAALLPVHTATACPARRWTVSPSGVVTATRRGGRGRVGVRCRLF